MGHGYNGSVYRIQNQFGVLDEKTASYPFVVKMSNRMKNEKNLMVPGKNDGSLEKEFEVEKFFKDQIPPLWQANEMRQFEQSWQVNSLPIALVQKRSTIAVVFFCLSHWLKGWE